MHNMFRFHKMDGEDYVAGMDPKYAMSDNRYMHGVVADAHGSTAMGMADGAGKTAHTAAADAHLKAAGDCAKAGVTGDDKDMATAKASSGAAFGKSQKAAAY